MRLVDISDGIVLLELRTEDSERLAQACHAAELDLLGFHPGSYREHYKLSTENWNGEGGDWALTSRLFGALGAMLEAAALAARLHEETVGGAHRAVTLQQLRGEAEE
jgi:hypothetical protein